MDLPVSMPVTMPGSFLADHDPIRPTLTRASANSSLFLPPQSPSAASSLSRSIRANPRTVSGSSNGSRKRARDDSTSLVISTLRATPQCQSDASLASVFSEALSPHPFVNTNYRIAGGLDTPTVAQSLDLSNSIQEEQDYRQCRFRLQQPTQSNGYFPQTPALLAREGNGRQRAQSTPNRPGWSKTVWTYAGDVAGKVINFCWNSAFSGFHAGGGRAYQISTTPSNMEQSIWSDIGDKEDVFHANYRARGSTPIPGGFPRETFIKDYMSHPQSYHESDISTPTQLDHGRGGGSQLRTGWTMVSKSDAQSREASPLRKRSKSGLDTIDTRRPVSRASMVSRPKMPPSRPSGSNASFASPRAGSSSHIQSHSRPSTSDGPIHGHRRSRSSIASPRRPDLHFNEIATSTSPEVKHFEKKIRRKEKVQDESIRKLNRQLKDMIREGKQALGTTVEIQDDSDLEDEGYEGSERGGTAKVYD